MDILSPKLVWIDGSCYRVNPNTCGDIPSSSVNSHKELGQSPYVESGDHDLEDYCDDDESIELTQTTSNGRWTASLPISSFFFSIIIGTKGTTLKRLQNETKTEIFIPGRGKKGDIVITGPDTKSVTSAVSRIKLLVANTRKKSRPNVFVSVPAKSDELAKNFSFLKEELLKYHTVDGIQESEITIVEKLHMTLCVLLLLDDKEEDVAMKALKDANENIIMPFLKDTKIELTLKGLDIMGDDPSSATILYIKPEEDEKFRFIVEKINECYMNNNLIVRQRPNVLLHVTVVKSDDRQKPFDATNILKKYGTMNFGKIPVASIQLCLIENHDHKVPYTCIGSVDT